MKFSDLRNRANSAITEPAIDLDDDDEKVKCKKCKTMNDADAKFCQHCGKKITSDSDARAAKVEKNLKAISGVTKMLGRALKKLDAQIAAQPTDELSMFTAKEREALGLVPASSAVVMHEGKAELGLLSPSEAHALKGSR